MQVTRPGFEVQVVGHGDGAGPEPAVGQHDALGKARGAAGVEDAGQVLAGPLGILGRGVVGDQGLVVQHAVGRLAVTGIDQGFDRRLGQDLGHHVDEGVVDDHHPGARIVERIGVLGR